VNSKVKSLKVECRKSSVASLKPGVVDAIDFRLSTWGLWTACAALLTLDCLSAASARGQSIVERFPPPDFASGYVFPTTVQGAPRLGWLLWLDVAMLVAGLTLAALLVFRWRSRRGLVWLSIGSVLYFGFYRKGCICPIGSIQNIAQGVFDPSYLAPIGALIFFALPLLYALGVGRVFCGGVCPLGAVQDLVLVKPIRMADWLAGGLGMLRYFYLGLAVLLAATGTSYVICEYDPFIGFFRLSARFHIWIWSGAVVLVSLFIGRPYCRFLCPYGALLGIFSRFAHMKVEVTPDPCAACDSCHDECPFGSIREAIKEKKM
jgi:polyferredoxin